MTAARCTAAAGTGRPRAERATIANVITGLGAGGAERMLQKLVLALDAEHFTSELLSLTPGGRLTAELRDAGIVVWEPDGRGPAALARVIGTAARAWRGRPPALVQGWMPHGNLVAMTLGRVALRGRVPVVWNVRQSIYDLADETPSTARLIRLAGRLSRAADRIVYNSTVAAAQHEALGYAASRTVVVPNGFDLARFRPNQAARASARAAWGVTDDTVVVGMVARVHYHKDYPTFLRAIRALADRSVPVVGVAIGSGVDAPDGEVSALARELGLTDRLRLLGDHADVARLYPGLDVACLSSRTEGFPNVLGEAMATGVPCVATDVGATAELVADTGRVVPARDPAALAQGLAELAAAGPEGRAALGRCARARVASMYSLEAVAHRYARLYSDLLRDDS